MIAGHYDKDVWDRIVPQACQEEASIKHLTVALAAVNMTITAITDGDPNTETPLSVESRRREAWGHTAVGLKHYAKALALMRRLTSSDLNDEYQLRNALLSCFGTMTFEFYQGNKEAAVRQGAAGIELLKNFHQRRFGVRPINVSTIPCTPVIDSDLIASFGHIQSLIALGVEIGNMPNSDERALRQRLKQKSLDEMPSEFHSLEDAQRTWTLTERGPGKHHQISPSQSANRSHLLVDVGNPDFVIDKPLITSIPAKNAEQDCINSMDADSDTTREGNWRWFKAFQPLYVNCRSMAISSSEYHEATFLMIRYLISELRIVPDTSLTNDFLVEALQVLCIAEELLGSEAPSTEAEIYHSTKCLDEGLATALCLAAVKCQDRVVRRKAIALLEKNSGIDGYWDSIMAAKISAWFVEQEEKVERESKLVSRFVIEYVYMLPDRKVSMCLSKQLKNEPHRILTPPVTLTW